MQEQDITKNDSKKVNLKRRIGIWAVGFLGNEAIVQGFDKILYPIVIWNYGPYWGGGVMTIASFLICWLTFLFYDWAKEDWIAIETIKEHKETAKGIVGWALRQSEWVAFIVLSIWTDPFITTAYLRKGSFQFNGLSKRDWKIFIGSLIIGNLEWIIVISGGIVVLKNYILPYFGM